MPRRKPRRGVETSASGGRHVPVLLTQVLEALEPKDGATYIDATFGAGGYTRAILDAAECKVTAFDRDPTAIAGAVEMLSEYGERLRLLQSPFGDLYNLTSPDSEAGLRGAFDGVVFDLGVSSMQLDQPERGFSFQADGPLDMRMEGLGNLNTQQAGVGARAGGREQVGVTGDAAEGSMGQGDQAGLSAADVVNTFEEADLADIIFRLGEEKRSRAIAKAIVAQRADQPFSSTLELANLIQKVLGRGPPGKHPATRTFQALRMFVNDELGQLLHGLVGAERALKPGGKLVVVTFHSIEDRIVKRFINSRCGKTEGVSRHMPVPAVPKHEPSFQIINSRSLTSSKDELEANPRARSARLRMAVRTDAPDWPLAEEDAAAFGIPRLRVG
ncbi:MAG: 16S rRNA (cytosine(1402)-N(4))-methyltransferase RsmH [Filomicrobium sp.]